MDDVFLPLAGKIQDIVILLHLFNVSTQAIWDLDILDDNNIFDI